MQKQWNCSVCKVLVVGMGRIGTRCADHRKHRRFTCGTCGTPFWSNRHTTTGDHFCSQPCSRRPSRQHATHKVSYRTVKLDWKQCPCGKWICKPGRRYCGLPCRREAQRLDCEARRRRNGVPINSCRRCGIPVQHPLQFCPDHREAALKDSRRRMTERSRRKYGTTHRSRARRFGVEYEPVNKQRVFERDGWRCGICGERVDRRLKAPHPMRVSIDHIVPMALGGGHTYINTQCSHLRCNWRKSFRSYGDQLALFG